LRRAVEAAPGLFHAYLPRAPARQNRKRAAALYSTGLRWPRNRGRRSAVAMADGVRIFRSLEEARPEFGPSALTIGNFDGVHAGHRRILRRTCEVAKQNGWKPSVLTSHPHPTGIVAPARSPRLMTTPEQRCRLMEQEGI